MKTNRAVEHVFGMLIAALCTIGLTGVAAAEKVDVMFINEAKNAFTRYNKEKYYNQTFEASIVPLDEDRKLLIISGFTNAADAVSYVQEARKIAHLEIVPWLKNDKYSFSIMSDSNLPILLEKKDLPQYSKFLDQNLPGKF